MKNKKRLIDANALVEHIKDLPSWWADDGGVYPGGSMKYPDGMYYPEDIISSIGNAPTVDAVEVVHAQWEPYAIQPNGFVGSYRCTACGNASINDSNYCHNCGAKMDGGSNNE